MSLLRHHQLLMSRPGSPFVIAWTEPIVGGYTWIVPPGVNSVDVLVVGQGGGCPAGGGGGGGGGVVYTEAYSVTPGESIYIYVAGRVLSPGSRGESSTFGSIEAIGGGEGGSPGNAGNSGASGGGGGASGNGYNVVSGGSAILFAGEYQGTGGGSGGGLGSTLSRGGGGGGGAGVVGGPQSAANPTTPGAGGNGVDMSMHFGTIYGDSGWFGGGGAGGAATGSLGTFAPGGKGGGGDYDGNRLNNGTPNTGGGGGGHYAGGRAQGGSGIVIVKGVLPPD